VGDVQGRLSAYKALPSVLDIETRRLEKDARARIADLRGALRRNPEAARKALEKVLTGPLVFPPIDTPKALASKSPGRPALGAFSSSVLRASLHGRI
jgi:site-specific DNA recombinase